MIKKGEEVKNIILILNGIAFMLTFSIVIFPNKWMLSVLTGENEVAFPIIWIVYVSFSFLTAGITFSWLIKKVNTKNNIIFQTIPINNKNHVLVKLNNQKNEIYNTLQEIAVEMGISIQLFQSIPIDDEVLIECRIDNRETLYKSKVSFLKIHIYTLPFHRYDILINLDIYTNNYQKTFKQVVYFDRNEITEVLKIMTSDSGKINYHAQCSNSIRYTNHIEDKYNKDENIAVLAIPPLIKRLIFGKEPIYKVTMGKPNEEPRLLIPFDSWQTLVSDIGNEKYKIIEEIQEKFNAIIDRESNLKIFKEDISYWGINGKEEKEQLVCIFNRSYVFINIYDYGKDLYIGWNANLNYGTWEEYKVTEGYTNGYLKNIDLFSVQVGWKEVNEYDLSDANFLLETVHSNITQIVKRIIKEREIDQEIDFSIVRESRKDALNAKKPKEDKKKNKFRRLS